jgi:hypothetical protein
VSFDEWGQQWANQDVERYYQSRNPNYYENEGNGIGYGSGEWGECK